MGCGALAFRPLSSSLFLISRSYCVNFWNTAPHFKHAPSEHCPRQGMSTSASYHFFRFGTFERRSSVPQIPPGLVNQRSPAVPQNPSTEPFSLGTFHPTPPSPVFRAWSRGPALRTLSAKEAPSRDSRAESISTVVQLPEPGGLSLEGWEGTATLLAAVCRTPGEGLGPATVARLSLLWRPRPC